MAAPNVSRPSQARLRDVAVQPNSAEHAPHINTQPNGLPLDSKAPSQVPRQPQAAPDTPPVSKPPGSRLHVTRDIRTYLPSSLWRFTGYRPKGSKAPFPPLQFPPFTWLARIPLKYEIWILSLIGSFVGIALIEMVMIGLAAEGVIMIVASFGASAVLSYGTIESPLAQPRHLVGGHLVSAIIGVGVTRLFRKAGAYELHDTTQHGDLGHVVWLNGALSMALALLAQQVTGTVHPPGGATALIASVQPAAVHMSWNFVYVVLLSSLVMLVWAMFINNVGRRRYPTYWLSGDTVFVRERQRVTTDQLHMEAEEGRVDGFAAMDRALTQESEKARARSSGATR